MPTKLSIKTLLSESKLLFLLALPLIGSGFIENSLGFFSTLFLAHLSQEALAAGALAAWMFATLMVIMWETLSAVSTLVSHRHGAQDHVGIARVIHDSLIFATIASIPCMLMICAFFQIFESIRITAFGTLRALKDTRFTLLISIITFWMIAIPLGYFLAIKLHWEGPGLWWGMVFSQLIGAAILVQRYQYRIKAYLH